VKAAAINLNINSIEGYKKAIIEDTNEENRDSYRSKISELEAKNEKLSKEAKDIDNTIKKFIQVVVGKTMSIDLKGMGLAEDITELTIDTFKMLNEECKRQNENAKIFIIIDIKNIDSEDKVKPSGSTREIQAIGKTQRFLIDLDLHQMLKGEYGSSFANEMGDVIFKVIGPRFLPNSYKKEKEMRGFGKTARELEKMYYKFPSSIFSFGYEEGYNELISKNEKKQ
nr:hypothetical protein [Bacteroidales bacterium]